MSKTVLALALLSVCTLANAHFGSVITDKQIVSDPKDSTLTITAAFNHPMEQAGMTMEKPKNFSVIVDGKKTDLTNTLQKTQVLDKDAWMTQYKVARPGCYKFVLEPQPYWEPAEDKFIIHYSPPCNGFFTSIFWPIHKEKGSCHATAPTSCYKTFILLFS